MRRDTLRRVLQIGLDSFVACGGTVRGILTLACLVFLQYSTGCGGNASGSGTPGGTTTPSNAVPIISSLSPNYASAGAATFTLAITGENFISSSTVQWNGSQRPTTYTSSTELQVQISADDVSTSGSAAVSVTNPAPGGGNSGAAEFIINATSNAAPTLASLNPSSVNAGTSGFLLTLNGANFVPMSSIQWNGLALPATYLSATQLEAQIPASNVAASGFADVVVLNPAPGGGASTPAIFAIAYAPVVVNQAANDLVWDAAHQSIYLSVPSLAASNGNTISVLDPNTGNITSSLFAGSEPNVLAISDDDQFLYAALDGSSSVQRYTLPGLIPDVSYLLGSAGFLGPYVAVDLQVAPGLPHTVALSHGVSNTSASAYGGMEIYDDATPRPNTAQGAYDSLQWGSDATIYGNNSESTIFDISVLTVNSSGVVLAKDYQNEFSTFYIKIHYDSGTKLIYTDDGYVVDPSDGKHVGAFQASGLMIPDSTLNSAYFLGQTQAQFGTQNFAIESFDLTTYAPTAEIVVPNVKGYPLRLIRWGANGLAFNDTAGYLYILNNPFVGTGGAQIKTPLRYISPVVKSPLSDGTIRSSKLGAWRSAPNPKKAGGHSHPSLASNPAPAITALSPSTVAAGINGFTLTVTGTNFLSLSTIQWNGTQLPTEYLSSSQLQAQVNSSNVADAGSVSVSVFTPSPGGGSSASLPFTIVSASGNPVPVVLGLYPDFVTAGSSGFTLSVNGLSYFNSSSVVLWNGSPRPTSLYSSGQLQVQISTSDVATAGYGQITVVNPGPGGGLSNTVEFQILYQPTIVSQATNDLVWDPLNQVMYISVPGSASTHANQVCVFNPTSAAIMNCQSGSEPDVLAISDDSQFLYVGMDGTNSVQRFILPTLIPDINYTVGTDPYDGPYYALDLQVAPGAPHTVAVSRGIMNLEPDTEGGIAIFDDSTQRPTTALGWGPTDHSYNSIQWGSNATELYSANSGTTGYDFYTLTVSSSGVALNQDYSGVFWNPGRIHYDRGSGLVYSDDGFHAVNPSTGLPAGIFEVGGGWPMAPDSSLNSVFMATKYVWQENANFTIDVFDMTHFTPFAHIPFSTVQNTLVAFNRFIRWGTNGLALNDTSGNIYLISGPLVTGHQSSGFGTQAKPVGAHKTTTISPRTP